MLLLQNLTRKEKVYLVELFNAAFPYQVTKDTLNSAKRGALELALNSLPNLDRRKRRVLENVLKKIVYSGIIEYEP